MCRVARPPLPLSPIHTFFPLTCQPQVGNINSEPEGEGGGREGGKGKQRRRPLLQRGWGSGWNMVKQEQEEGKKEGKKERERAIAFGRSNFRFLLRAAFYIFPLLPSFSFFPCVGEEKPKKGGLGR